MMEKLKSFGRTLGLYLKTPEIIYSLALIVLIPVLITVNSIVVIRLFTSVADIQAKDKATRATELVERTFTSIDQHAIQSSIDDITTNIKDNAGAAYFQRLDYLVKRNNEEAFLVIASNNHDRVGSVIKPKADSANSAIQNPDNYTQLNLSWSERNSFVAAAHEQSTPGYQVTEPINDPKTGQRQAVISAFVSTAYIDSLLTKSYERSSLLLTITVVITLALLFIRSRIYRYSTLFKRLQEVDQMKDEFISVASHELRAPLTSIRGNLSLLLQEHDLTETDRHHILDTASRSADQLTSLVADLLDVSRIEQGRLQLKPEKLLLAGVIGQIVEFNRPQANAKHLDISIECSADINVLADRHKLEQIFTNLITNAIKYTPKGSIRISATPSKDMIEVLVSDTGLGMSPEDRANLFNKFYRIKNSETSNIPGTGLGLWITKSLVEMMGGHIYVDSIKGAGTQFKFTVPKA